MRSQLAILALALGVAGCGTPGAPQPPSLHLPKPVDDLKAVRRGDKVYLSWTTPNTTTDEQGVANSMTTRICRTLATDPSKSCADSVADIAQTPADGGKRVERVDDISALVGSGQRDFIDYNVVVNNNRGRNAGAG